MAAVNSWSFERGFTRFVIEGERSRLAGVVEQLADRYQEQNGWGWIESLPNQVTDLLRPTQPHNRGRGAIDDAENGPRPDLRRGNGIGARGGRGLILVDADKTLLIGNRIPSSDLYWEPITVNNEAIGYIGIREPRGVPDGVASLFVRQQLRNNIFAAFAMVVLSALLAIPLASRLVKPILRINTAVGEISDGNYRHQIKDNSRNELGSLSKKINQLALTLDKNQSARQQWTAEISHELRTPVAVLQAEIEALQDGIKPIDIDSVNSLHAETQRLNRLISDLHALSLSDIGALDYSMATVDLSSIVQQRIAAASTQIEQARLNISFAPLDSTTFVRGDVNRLGQLIDNLIQNTVRYTHTNGQLFVSIAEATYNNAASIELMWCDSEPGVSDEQLIQLFDPLYRTEESRSREFGGAGLGLAIVKKIADAHNASLSAQHSPQGGLAVRVNFPIDEIG